MASASDFYFDPASLAAGLSSVAEVEVRSPVGVPEEGQPLVVAYQGEPGAYSEQATRQMFYNAGFKVTPLPCPSFSAVFDAVRSGQAQHCMVPIENSLGGSIHDNYDLLLRNKVTCVAELQFRVSHCLLALPGVRLEDIKECYSHPQALAQCEEYLTKLGIKAVKQYDTAGSAKMIKEQGLTHVAAIASELAASTYGLNVLARRIEDDEGNFTRFLLLAPQTTRNQQALYFQAPAPSIAGAAADEEGADDASRGLRTRAASFVGPAHPNVANLVFSPTLTRTTFKTSLVFTLPDAPGTLFKALSVFALRDMHLCKIESRPSKHVNFLEHEQRKTFAGASANANAPASSPTASPGLGPMASPTAAASTPYAASTSSSDVAVARKFEYLFFIDTLSSLAQNEALKNGVRHLREIAPFLRVLGSYPVFAQNPETAPASLASPKPSWAGPAKHHARTASMLTAAGKYATRPLRIGIHGFGTFGQFLSKTFVAQGHQCFVHSRSDYSALSATLGVHWVPSVDQFPDLELDVLILSMSIMSFEACVAAFPWERLQNVTVVDVLSVKEHPRAVLLEHIGKRGSKSIDILCTHPMFGPDSGKHSWKGLAFQYDKVRIAVDARCEAFLQCFAAEGCRMLQMSCDLHDEYAAGSQFLTHTTGRVLGALHPVSTPINTVGYTKLLQVVEQTQKDSWELYQGLYTFNQKSQEQLEKFGEAFDKLRGKLRAELIASPKLGAVASRAAAGSAAASVSFNPHVERMNESATVAMADLAKSMTAKGVKVVGLGVGEVLSVKTPQVVLDAACQALQDGQTTYTSANGMLPLREAICAKLLNENGLRYAPGQIVVSNGAKQCIFQAVTALLTPEENEVLIPAPFWVSYPDIVRLVGGRPVIVPTTVEEGYVLTAAKLRAAITPRTKLLILCSPSNPTGAVYTKAQLQALAEVLEEFPRVHVLSDEIYEHLLFNQTSHTSIASLSPSMFARTIVVNGMSKGYVMTGFRVGYLAAGNSEIAARVNKVQGQITSCASSISQHAALAALTKLGPEFRTNLVATLTQTRGLLLAALRAIPNVTFLEPEGAFYVLLDVHKYFGSTGTDGRAIPDSDALCMYLLEVYQVALVPGSAFGAPECLRISYASSDEIVLAGADALKRGLSELTR